MGTKRVSKYAHLEIDFWQSNHPKEMSLTPVLKEVIESNAEPLTVAFGFKVCESTYSQCFALHQILEVSASEGTPTEHSKKDEEEVDTVIYYSIVIITIGGERES